VSGSRSVAPLIRKEVRAQLSAWVAAAIAIAVVASPLASFAPPPVVLLVYGFGAIALGAQAIGLEYTHRTLPLLLCQPRSRHVLLGVKLGVMAVMVLTLGIFAGYALTHPTEGRIVARQIDYWPLVAWCGAAAACLTPFLSLICRGVLPAMVFTVAIPGALVTAGQLLAFVAGLDAGTVEAWRISLLPRIVAAVCAASAVGTFLLFSRLQALEGQGRQLELPLWLRGRSASQVGLRRRHPVAMLVAKELHLQHMTFVVVALYVCAWAAALATRRFNPAFPIIPIGALTLMYGALLAQLIGSLASAEERRFNTLQWQLLLPVAIWKQWLVKVGVVLGLTLLFGIGLPFTLNLMTPGAETVGVRLWPQSTIGLLLIAATGLYVSSLSSSGVRAMLSSQPVIGSAAILAVGGGAWLYSVAVHAFVAAWGGTRMGPVTFHAATTHAWIPSFLVTVAMAIAAVLMWLALANHRAVERSVRRVVAHAVVVAALVALAAIVPAMVLAYYVTR
jgi:hypothetical protein